jgi:dihydropteroate synthase
MSSWNIRGRAIELDRPLVLGVVNVTPDSFSDGGEHFGVSAALEHAGRMLEEGADILDVGGESTRPQGATPVSKKEELDRVIPVVAEIAARYPSCIISVDTVKSKVAEEALKAGAHIINDVSGFRLDPRMASVCAAHEAGAILMHSRGDVSDMSTYHNATYGADPVGDILGELLDTVSRAVGKGVSAAAIAIDPGIGFAKLSNHSLAVLRELRRFATLGYPLVVGVSRKRFIGELGGVHEPAARIFGSVAANVVALMNGAMLFRVHDVLASRQALDVAWGIITQGED